MREDHRPAGKSSTGVSPKYAAAMRLGPQIRSSPATSRGSGWVRSGSGNGIPVAATAVYQLRPSMPVEAAITSSQPQNNGSSSSKKAATRLPVQTRWLAIARSPFGLSQSGCQASAASTIPSGTVANKSRGSVGPVNHVPGPTSTGSTSRRTHEPSQSRSRRSLRTTESRTMPIILAAANAPARIDVPASSPHGCHRPTGPAYTSEQCQECHCR